MPQGFRPEHVVVSAGGRHRVGRGGQELCFRPAECKMPVKFGVEGFPGGAVVENLPANAGDTGSSPGLGRSHMLWSDWAREPQLLSLRVWSLCSATREAAIVRGPRTVMKSGPRLLATTRESPCTENEDPTQP